MIEAWCFQALCLTTSGHVEVGGAYWNDSLSLCWRRDFSVSLQQMKTMRTSCVQGSKVETPIHFDHSAAVVPVTCPSTGNDPCVNGDGQSSQSWLHNQQLFDDHSGLFFWDTPGQSLAAHHTTFVAAIEPFNLIHLYYLIRYLCPQSFFYTFAMIFLLISFHFILEVATKTLTPRCRSCCCCCSCSCFRIWYIP